MGQTTDTTWDEKKKRKKLHKRRIPNEETCSSSSTPSKIYGHLQNGLKADPRRSAAHDVPKKKDSVQLKHIGEKSSGTHRTRCRFNDVRFRLFHEGWGFG